MKESKLLYHLHDRPPFIHNLVYSLQWTVFMFSLNIVFPLVIGDLYQLSIEETAAFLQRTIFLIGMGSLLQVLWGHGLPLIEGISALWFSLFVLFAPGTGSLQGDSTFLLTNLQFGHIMLGVIMMALSFLGLLDWMQKLFTPLVTGCTLILLAVQLSGSFFQGLLGLEEGQVNVSIALFSLLLIGLVTYLSYRGSKVVKSFTVLLGMVLGWGLYKLLGLPQYITSQDMFWGQWFYVPKAFPWGVPQFSAGMVVTAAVASLVLISNQVASLAAAKEALAIKLPPGTGKRCGIMNGVSNILAGIFGGIGTIPLSNTAGFLKLTGVGARLPFAMAALILMLMGCVWPLGQLLTLMPTAVAYAVVFNIVSQMLGMGVGSLTRVPLKERELMIIGITLFSGVGLMFVPAAAYSNLPPIFQVVLSNGLLMGIMIVLMLEHFFLRKKDTGKLPKRE